MALQIMPTKTAVTEPSVSSSTTNNSSRRRKTKTTLKSNVLHNELEALERKTGVKTSYSIRWTPDVDCTKEGEVKFAEKIICIYSTNLDDATDTLRHEFFEILVCNAQKPYVDLIKILFHIISDQAYENKEEMIECLVSLVTDQKSIIG